MPQVIDITKSVAVAALALAATACAEPDESFETAAMHQPVVAGQPAGPGELYATVALYSLSWNKPYCTGTLIAPRVVATAAHCLVEDDGTPLFGTQEMAIIAGDLNANAPTQANAYPVASFVAHPSYPGAWNSEDPDGMASYGDIGVIVLGAPIEDHGIAPVLADGSFWPAQGEELLVSGYGINDMATGAAGVLYIGAIPFQRRNETEFVAGAYNSTDACNGDSGGPVYRVIDGYLYLVGATSRASTSASIPCGQRGIYTATGAYADWMVQASGGLFGGAVSAGGDPPGGGASSSTGSGNGAGSSGSGNTSGSGQPGAEPLYIDGEAAGYDEGGCSVASPGSSSSKTAALVALLIGLMALARRNRSVLARRPHRAWLSAVVALLLATVTGCSSGLDGSWDSEHSCGTHEMELYSAGDGDAKLHAFAADGSCFTLELDVIWEETEESYELELECDDCSPAISAELSCGTEDGDVLDCSWSGDIAGDIEWQRVP